jgi:hypothetical protein
VALGATSRVALHIRQCSAQYALVLDENIDTGGRPMMRRNRTAGVAFRLARALVVLLYIGGGVALLFAAFGYVFSLVHYGVTVGFVLQFAGRALWLALGLLVLAMLLDVLVREDGEHRR